MKATRTSNKVSSVILAAAFVALGALGSQANSYVRSGSTSFSRRPDTCSIANR